MSYKAGINASVISSFDKDEEVINWANQKKNRGVWPEVVQMKATPILLLF